MNTGHPGTVLVDAVGVPTRELLLSSFLLSLLSLSLFLLSLLSLSLSLLSLSYMSCPCRCRRGSYSCAVIVFLVVVFSVVVFFVVVFLFIVFVVIVFVAIVLGKWSKKK